MAFLRLFISLFIFSLVSAGLHAQSQQGYVKTLGRPNKPGVPLSNVTVRMRGVVNAVLTGADGKFSVQMPGKKSGDAIILQSVRKSGYELVDPSLVGRQQVFSPSVPIVIVMVNSAELAANKQRIERIAYQKAEKNYQTRLKELEKEVEEQKLTEEQYRQELQSLQDKYEKYQALIEGMADRYARTDYDHLDSIDKEINICIENGELEKADSLIHTAFDPTTAVERNRAAKEAVRVKMELAQQIIDKANADREAILKDIEYAKKVALLSENLAEEFLIQGDFVKAKGYLEKSLDIKTVIYGEQSAEVEMVQKKMAEIKDK